MDKILNIQYKKIKKGYITKLPRLRFLRDDIPCNIAECKDCDGSKNILDLEHPIIFLTSDLLLNQMDAVENFSIIDNAIIPLSEYTLVLKNEKISKRLNTIIEYRNMLIYPNDFNKAIADIPDEGSLTQEQIRKEILTRTINYYHNHISNFSQQFHLIVLTSSKDKHPQNENKNITYYTLQEYAKEKLNESPDLFNYISHEDSAMDVDETSVNYAEHLSENEMKANIKDAKMFQGKIFFQPGIYNTAVVKSQLFKKDIVIEGNEHLNRALNGDIVCFTLLNESEWKKNAYSRLDDEGDGEEEEEEQVDIEKNTSAVKLVERVEKTSYQPLGHIEGILRRNREIFCGTIYNPGDEQANSLETEANKSYYSKMAANPNFAIFIPIDSKYPFFQLYLTKKDTYYNQRIVVKFDKWSQRNFFPSVHFVRKLGKCLDVPVENDIILYEHNVDINPFSQKIINSMPREDVEFKCPEDELEKRMDLRDLNVCSIDPPGCKDIDDALHCRVLENGNYEVGVHIADVTHYVKPNSDVDKIAAKNCNTIYLVHKRTDMLPKVLTENLCSLVGKKERLAFSVLWEMDKDSLEILNVKYGKSVIKSKAALTYEKANTMINDPADKSELTEGIRNLNKIAKHLKQGRIQQGALILASNEMKFNLDNETNTITDISTYKTFETNSLVEEFMLLANVWVAKKIYESFPSCAILRRHPPPKEKELGNFVNILKERGYELDTKNSTVLGESLDKIKKSGDPYFNKLVRSLLTRTMNQAKYFPSCEFSYEEFYHYGLAMEIYTHFTSPIRRYSDVLVHRLLAAALEIDYLPSDMSNKVKADRECTQMNRQNRVGFFCGKDSNYFSAFTFFKEHAEERKGIEIVIHSIDEFFVKGISVKYGIEATLDFGKVGGVKSKDLEKMTIVIGDGQKIELFDHVNVEINTVFYNYRYEIKYYFLNKIELK